MSSSSNNKYFRRVHMPLPLPTASSPTKPGICKCQCRQGTRQRKNRRLQENLPGTCHCRCRQHRHQENQPCTCHCRHQRLTLHFFFGHVLCELNTKRKSCSVIFVLPTVHMWEGGRRQHHPKEVGSETTTHKGKDEKQHHPKKEECSTTQ